MGPHSAAGNKIDKMFRLLLAASLAVATSAMPQMVYIQQSPGVISQVVQPVHKAVVQPQVVTVEEPKEVFKPTTYVASPQPFFFGMNGMGAIWNNNMGGKADYDATATGTTRPTATTTAPTATPSTTAGCSGT